MLAPQRRHDPVVIDRLLQSPQQFDFFQAVRMLERWLDRPDAAANQSQGLQRLNFRNSLSTGFAPSAIESLKVHRREDLDAEAGDALNADHVERIDMTPAFMGMLGVHGALPLFYTEALAQRELYQKDDAGRAFMDLFSHRMLTLFYEAWRKHRLPLQFEVSKRQHFLPQVLALAGLGQKGLRDRQGSGMVADEALAYFAGTLQQRTVSARQLQQLLQGYLNVPVRIEQFVGRWYALPVSARSGLGQGTQMGQGVLGRSAVLGERVWQRDMRLRVELGPLPHERFLRFLPGGAGAKALETMLTMLSGVSLEYEVQLTLRQEDVKPVALDSERTGSMGRLGWDTFLQSRPATQDRQDVRYDIQAMAAA